MSWEKKNKGKRFLVGRGFSTVEVFEGIWERRTEEAEGKEILLIHEKERRVGSHVTICYEGAFQVKPLYCFIPIFIYFSEHCFVDWWTLKTTHLLCQVGLYTCMLSFGLFWIFFFLFSLVNIRCTTLSLNLIRQNDALVSFGFHVLLWAKFILCFYVFFFPLCFLLCFLVMVRWHHQWPSYWD